jgi:uncharacterized membrane protein YgcG
MFDRAPGSSSQSSASASTTGAVPGKSTLTQQLPVDAAAGARPPSGLLALVGQKVTDGSGYTFELKADGSFVIVGAPPDHPSAIGKPLRPNDSNPGLAKAWATLAAKIQKEHPQPAAAAATPATAASPDSPAPAPAASSGGLLGGLGAIGSAVSDMVSGLGDLLQKAWPSSPPTQSTGMPPAPAARGNTAGAGTPSPAQAGPGAAPASDPANTGANAGGATGPASMPKPAAATGPVAPTNHQSRSSFVKPGMPSSVTDHANTSAILDAIWPYFNKGDIVIGGFLSAGQQAWKVNYHWELVIWCCDKAQSLDITDAAKKQFDAIATALRGNAPSPSSGYLSDSQMTLADSSDQASCDARYTLVLQAKKDLAAAIEASSVTGKITGATADRFKLAPQYVKPAGKSKHGTGYALDIKGDNARIQSTAASLGRSGLDDEDFHVHVEFASGPKLPTTPGGSGGSSGSSGGSTPA